MNHLITEEELLKLDAEDRAIVEEVAEALDRQHLLAWNIELFSQFDQKIVRNFKTLVRAAGFVTMLAFAVPLLAVPHLVTVLLAFGGVIFGINIAKLVRHGLQNHLFGKLPEERRDLETFRNEREHAIKKDVEATAFALWVSDRLLHTVASAARRTDAAFKAALCRQDEAGGLSKDKIYDCVEQAFAEVGTLIEKLDVRSAALGPILVEQNYETDETNDPEESSFAAMQKAQRGKVILEEAERLVEGTVQALSAQTKALGFKPGSAELDDDAQGPVSDLVLSLVSSVVETLEGDTDDDPSDDAIAISTSRSRRFRYVG